MTIFDRYLAAMNATRDRALLAAAVCEDVEIDRHAGGIEGGAIAPIADTYAGIEAVAAWFARTPVRCVFALLGEPVREGAGDATWRVGYSISVDDFYNTGVWIATFAADGRVAHLSHRPHALQDHG